MRYHLSIIYGFKVLSTEEELPVETILASVQKMRRLLQLTRPKPAEHRNIQKEAPYGESRPHRSETG